MPLERPQRLTTFDAAAALSATRDATDDGVLSFVEFTGQEWNALYVDDRVVDQYDGVDHLDAHYDRVLSYVNMDFVERDTYEDTLLPESGRVRAIVTLMDEITLLRVVLDTEGVYVALAPGTSVHAATDAIESVLLDG